MNLKQTVLMLFKCILCKTTSYIRVFCVLFKGKMVNKKYSEKIREKSPKGSPNKSGPKWGIRCNQTKTTDPHKGEKLNEWTEKEMQGCVEE